MLCSPFTYSVYRHRLSNYGGPCTWIGVANVGSITVFARGRKSLSDGIMGDFDPLLFLFVFVFACFKCPIMSPFTISMTGIIIICLRSLSYHAVITAKCRKTSWPGLLRTFARFYPERPTLQEPPRAPDKPRRSGSLPV